ncbi:LacI family DNA-binding transcriptional regulator [Microbacterium sp. STN6]|uniref:LacI family DNA-binding transcriptional regulator n=1 Tax=Microbacterium sp. STN6 TaxID=2995588 RepID=UPI0022609F9C|nr:LacI family DNA-binding transcriptional regulator [Microbacterium sp. STN6]MCX7521808.1 LacI family DNA-binding transcriptional regulator [Microbacterium sp. STN6]
MTEIDSSQDTRSGAPARSRSSKPAPTIYDIAELAGVNPSTVSRALSKPGRISAKTEKLIQDAAKTLNYRVNPMARALPTGRTMTLGLIIADITNPMFFDVVRGAERAARESGYTLIIAESQESGEREAATAERVAPSVDGMILVTTRLADEQIADLAELRPLVVINRRIDGVDAIVPDLEPGIDQALTHLAELGHRSIGYLYGPSGSWMSSARWEALLAKSVELGMSIVEIGPGIPTLEGGRASMTRVAASGVSAVVAYNDLMAIGLLRAAQEKGLRVPGDLSIVGFDDIFGSDFTSPPLSTIRTPLALIGTLAVRRMLERIAADDRRPAHGSRGKAPAISTELVVRGSTGPAGA